MDGFKVHVRGDKREQFDLAMRLAFSQYEKVTHWIVTQGWLQLLWHADKGATPLPSPMKVEQAIPFVWGWWSDQEPQGNAPDIDGSVEPCGFEVESLGDDAWSYVFVRVRRVWALYGK